VPGGFSGERVELYQRYRHGYPDDTLDAISDALELGADDVAVDLGCGTGQLTLPLAARVREVIGVDPEPDMLAAGRGAADTAGLSNVSWMIGSDRDVPALRATLGDESVAAITVGQALHWMDDRQLLSAARPLLRPGGGIAIVTNGTPLWLQDSGWSRAVRVFLEAWLGCELTDHCGTDRESQQRYREHLEQAGYEVLSSACDYVAQLSFDQLLGGVLSAMGEALPPPARRSTFAEGLRGAVGPAQRFAEPVRVAVLIGRA
jgi:ubiquinone/menaquinone biosynthesis C-methylase UbiE